MNEAPLEDQELVQKLLAKEDEAYRYFYSTYRPRIYKVCVYLLGYKDPDAEDVTQEVFLAALKQLPKFEFRSSLFHWLHRICTFLCYERIRKRKRLLSSLNEDLEALAGPSAVGKRVTDLQDERTKKRVDLVLEQKKLLGEFCRDLLEKRDGEGMSYAQISEIMKVPLGTVNSRLARCKEALKNLVIRALKEARLG